MSLVDFMIKHIPGCTTDVNYMHEKSNILVVGVGALGCEVIKNLVMSGFTNISLIDNDVVEKTNLNRQLLFTIDDINKPKAIAAADAIKAMYPEINIKGYKYRVEDICEKYLRRFHVVFSCVDTVDTRRYLNNVIHKNLSNINGDVLHSYIVPLIDGGIEGLKGHARVVIPSYTACLECDISLYENNARNPICTISNNPKSFEHCLEYVRTDEWDSINPFNTNFNIDDNSHFKWVYNHAVKKARRHSIDILSEAEAIKTLTEIIPAAISTVSTVAALCVLECAKIITSYFKQINGMMFINLTDSFYYHIFHPQKNPDCHVCGSTDSIEYFTDKSSSIKNIISELTIHDDINDIFFVSYCKNDYKYKKSQISFSDNESLSKSFEELNFIDGMCVIKYKKENINKIIRVIIPQNY